MHLACVSSRPGQSGRCDGYILEGKELEFYSNQRRQNNDYTLASLHQRNYVFKIIFILRKYKVVYCYWAEHNCFAV